MLRRLLQEEFIRRHGFGVMSVKIRPVHVANALFRETLGQVGRTRDLEPVFEYTANNTDDLQKARALRTLVERDHERWGSLAESAEDSETSLGPVLRMIRTLLGADGAVFGTSPEKSSFSTPTGLLLTSDVSDEHAGAWVHHLWQEDEQAAALLAQVAAIIDPDITPERMNDLTALFAPLAGESRSVAPDSHPVASHDRPEESEVCHQLRTAAANLAAFEVAANPNPIATLERAVTLGCLSLFRYASTRQHECNGSNTPVLLLDATGLYTSEVATASTASVAALMDDARGYLAALLRGMINEVWSPEAQLDLRLVADEFYQRYSKTLNEKDKTRLAVYQRIVDEASREETGLDLELVLNDLMDELHRSEATLGAWMRLLGVRSGLLYPQTKTLKKRLVPTDRMVEVLVKSSMDVTNEVLEYGEFLQRLWTRFGIITGGRPGDDRLLRDANLPKVSSKNLRANADLFLRRLASQGYARPMADSIALVGLLE
jgi:hypothetical protein